VNNLFLQVSDYVVGREHGLYPPAAGSILVVLEQVDSEQVEDVGNEHHLKDVIPPFVVFVHFGDIRLYFFDYYYLILIFDLDVFVFHVLAYSIS